MEAVSVCAVAERIRFGLKNSFALKQLLPNHLDIFLFVTDTVPVLGNFLWLVPKKEFAFGITVRYFADFPLMSFFVAGDVYKRQNEEV